jgi:Uma2 family endonuclease
VRPVLGPELGLKGPISRPDGEFRGRTCVLFLHQVATKTQIPAEQYLRMTFEHDAEFVHGEIVERSMPTYIHARIQILLGFLFQSLRPAHALFACAELRCKIGPDVFRIPDICVMAGTQPKESVPDQPPLVALEILSTDDRHTDLMQKLEEYLVWGVPNIWVIDPATQRFSIYTELGLQNVSSFSLAGYPFQLAPAELFSQL